jgi:pectinesterase
MPSLNTTPLIRRIHYLFAAAFLLVIVHANAASTITLTVHNPTNFPRTAETISLHAPDLVRLLRVSDIRTVHVRDQRSGVELLTQAVDNDGDGKYDELIFQTDLAPRETRNFELSAGERRIPAAHDFKAYGRFVREREDDFAWENDRIAHRTYGKALETWLQEPLTSSAIDVWTKRVPRLVINDWYMVDDYHREHGEGGDFYSAGDSRGCGGNGIWAGNRLYPSANFVDSRVLANGPIRLIFELTYPAWEMAGARVSEVKRITLDAGQNFDHLESHYTIDGNSALLEDAIGIRKGTNAQSSSSREEGTLRTWEKLGDHGQLGCAVIAEPSSISGFTEDQKNFLVTVKLPVNRVVSYYAGFGWSNDGFPKVEDWDRYVAEYAERLKSPVKVAISAQ